MLLTTKAEEAQERAEGDQMPLAVLFDSEFAEFMKRQTPNVGTNTQKTPLSRPSRRRELYDLD